MAQLCQKLERIQSNQDTQEPRALKHSVYASTAAHTSNPVQASDNSAIMFFNPGPELDSPGGEGLLDSTKTPNQSLFPLSRQEEAVRN